LNPSDFMSPTSSQAVAKQAKREVRPKPGEEWLSGIVAVLTSKSAGEIGKQGGTYPWIADPKRVLKCDYVVCVRTRLSPMRPQGPEPHRQAFLVGRISDVVKTTETPGRHRINFSEFALIAGPEVHWVGANPLHYFESLAEIGIDPDKLNWTKVVATKSKETARGRG